MRLDALTPRIWRHGIAFAIAFDAVQLVIRTRMRAPLAASPLPGWPLARDLALSTPLLAALALLSVTAAAFFARGRRPLLTGLFALAANRLLIEAFGAVEGVFDEASYHAGAALLGWLCGCLYARALGDRRDEREVDGMAALGAVAMFSATYLNAGISKLRDSGLSWADSDTIRLMILSHRSVGGVKWSDGLGAFVVAHPTVAMALSLGTLGIQCGAFLFPWTRRTRAIWGALFLSFHVGINLVAPAIFFLQAVFLTVLFAVPWSDVLVRAGVLRAPPEVEETPPPPEQARRMKITCAAVLALIAALGFAPLRPRSHPIEVLHPAGNPRPSTPSTPAKLGPIAIGMELEGGWTVRTLVVEEDRAVITIVRDDKEIVFDVHHHEGAPRGYFDTGGLHVFYRETPVPFEAFRPAGDALAHRLAEAAGGGALPSAFDGWMEDAR